MDRWIASARPLGRALTATAAAVALAAAAFGAAPSALAQAKKPAAKPAQKQAPAAKPAEQPPQQAEQGKPQLMYSPWTKVCEKGTETNNKQVCVIAKDGRLENGQPVVIAQIIEPQGAERKLRVIVPIPVRVQNGTRILIDDQELAKAPFGVCAPQLGCTADYKADDATLTKLKKGKMIVVQAFNVFNKIVSLPLPLTDFAKAYDGAPIDPKALAAQQHQLQSELQKKAEEARKKLEAQQPTKK